MQETKITGVISLLTPKQNYKKGVEAYNMAVDTEAEASKAEASRVYTSRYIEGKKDEAARKYLEAKKYFISAGNYKDKETKKYLAFLSQRFLGYGKHYKSIIAYNFNRAVVFLKGAADLGNQEAIFHLISIGETVMVHQKMFLGGGYEEAAICFRVAAEHGHLKAQWHLFDLYEKRFSGVNQYPPQEISRYLRAVISTDHRRDISTDDLEKLYRIARSIDDSVLQKEIAEMIFDQYILRTQHRAEEYNFGAGYSKTLKLASADLYKQYLSGKVDARVFSAEHKAVLKDGDLGKCVANFSEKYNSFLKEPSFAELCANSISSFLADTFVSTPAGGEIVKNCVTDNMASEYNRL